MNLERYLSAVEKPGRYVGSEYNIITKEHQDVAVTVALCYPDLYEIGMSNYGMHILYHIINRRVDALCERVFAVWTDCEAAMRNRGVPISSLETGPMSGERSPSDTL